MRQRGVSSLLFQDGVAYKCLQLLPADGWVARFEGDDDSGQLGYFDIPIAFWALCDPVPSDHYGYEEQTRRGVESIYESVMLDRVRTAGQQIFGVDMDDGFPSIVDGTENFMRFCRAGESEPRCIPTITFTSEVREARIAEKQKYDLLKLEMAAKKAAKNEERSGIPSHKSD